MDIKQEILNLKNIINVADLPAAIDQLIADIDASGVLSLQAELDKAALQAELDKAALQAELDKAALQAELDKAALQAELDKAALHAELDKAAYDHAVSAAAARYDFEEVARLQNSVTE